ncbi:unnamed protein product [Adineta ricciae]|uniref:Apple domain-containing protein n=1 Tax=Adineta ricciae TaxID=249248 RepID=A0A815TFT2_ADIRI|nr:unnamed protein product [Adineta ricciae]
MKSFFYAIVALVIVATIAARSSDRNRLLRRLKFTSLNHIGRSNERRNMINNARFYFNARETSAPKTRCGEILVDTIIRDADTYDRNPLFLTTDTAEDCGNHCESLPNCVAWTYHVATLDCYPMVHIQETPGTYIGYKSGFCNGKSAKQEAECTEVVHDQSFIHRVGNLETVGYYKYQKVLDTAEKCRDYCNSIPECLAWLYDDTTHVCHPETTVKPLARQSTGSTSGFCNRQPAVPTARRCSETIVDKKIEDADTYENGNPLFLTTDTAEECGNRCELLANCVAWTYRSATLDCNPMVHVKEEPVPYSGYKSAFCKIKPAKQEEACTEVVQDQIMLYRGKYDDNDFAKYAKTLNTAEECRDYCNSTPECLAWMHEHLDNTCSLKTAVKPDAEYARYYTSGFCNRKPTIILAACSKIVHDRTLAYREGSDEADIKKYRKVLNTTEECRDYCNSISECLAWEYNDVGHDCDLKTVVKPEAQYFPGAISGFCNRKPAT